MKNNYNKKIILTVLLVALLIAMVGGVTYAFFNYTRTGVANTLQVGRIAFNSTQNNTITLENVFPTSSTNLNSSNSDTVTITITGDTTYSEGIEYKVTLEDVNNTVNDKEVPISFNVTANNLGTKDTSYYTNRGGENPIYNLAETGQVEDGKYILVGYIPSGEDGVNGSIDITAFIDANRVAISDTLENGPIVETGYVNGTTSDWVLGREVFTTNEWNSFNSSNPLSFKVRVEANEGIWVEEPKILVMKNLRLANDSNWKNIRGNITSIEFSTSSEIPSNAITSFDATDITSSGPVKVYTLDDGLGNGTFKAIICGDGIIYAPENSSILFAQITKLTNFNSRNFKVDNVQDLSMAFMLCTDLMYLSGLKSWNTSNVLNMLGLFYGCSNLVEVNSLTNWDTSNVNSMTQMFEGCSRLTNINGLIDWNVSNVTNMEWMFRYCNSLTNINGLINWNTSNVTNMDGMFRYCNSLTNINGLINWNTSNVNSMAQMFEGCSRLTNISGLLNWDVSNVTNMTSMFVNCYNLIDFSALSGWANKTGNVTTMEFMFGLNPSQTKTGNPIIDFSCLANWDVSNVTNMKAMFQNVNVKSYLPFKNWNVSKVQNFWAMFNATTASTVTTLEGLEDWNVSSATDMEGMFFDNVSLTDASAINDWNINANINFNEMFAGTPVHPEFTKVSGTWSNGTFTPNA